MSSDISEPQIIDEKNSDESQFECIPDDMKDNNSTSSNPMASNSSNEEQSDKEIVEVTKQDNPQEDDKGKKSQKNNNKQGYRIINNSNSSGSDSQDNSQEEEVKVTFTDKIKQEIAVDLKSKIIEQNFFNSGYKSFIRKVQQNPKIQDDMSEYIQDHIYEFEHIFQEIFQENQTVQKLNGEAIEVIVIKPLHDILMNFLIFISMNVYRLIQKYPVKQDKRLEFYFRVYEFINLNMFEIDSSVLKHPNYAKAIKCIHKIDSVKTPKEKLAFIVTANTLLSKAVQSVFPNTPIGADQLLPMMIFTIIQAKPERPYANLLFTQDYRCKWRIKGMEQYYLATYESALEFIDSIDAQKLKINESIFDKLYSKNYEKYKELGYLHEFEQKRVNQYLTSAQSLQMLKKVEKQMQDLHQKMNIDESLNLKFVNQNLSNMKLTQLPEIYAEYQIMVDSYKDMVQRTSRIISSLDDFSHNDNKKSIFSLF